MIRENWKLLSADSKARYEELAQQSYASAAVEIKIADLQRQAELQVVPASSSVCSTSAITGVLMDAGAKGINCTSSTAMATVGLQDGPLHVEELAAKVANEAVLSIGSSARSEREKYFL